MPRIENVIMWMYGEDGMTHWALTRQLRRILDEFGDQTPEQDAVVFFRPSFGRKGGMVDNPRCEFGEFDAIVGTKDAVYLIEAKTRTSKELQSSHVSLDYPQIRRHQVFRAYLDQWRNFRADDWAEFQRIMQPILDPFESLLCPHKETLLANNLRFVLENLQCCGEKTQDVLMIFCRQPSEEYNPPRLAEKLRASPLNFRAIVLPNPESNYQGHQFFDA